MKRNNLDERQEQIMLRIEHNGFWIAFWMLFALMLIQEITSGADFRIIMGECATLLVISLYMVLACLKNGIWDRKLKANSKTNLLASLAAGVVIGFVNYLALRRFFDDRPMGAVAAGIVIDVIVFVLCMLALTLAMRSYMKRTAALEEEPEDDMEL